MLEAVDISKYFKEQAVLQEVTLKVGSEIKVIIGLNGSGKSTLLKIIAGIIKGDGGQVKINGQIVTNFSPEKRGVGYVPQHPALFNHLTVWDNIIYSVKNGRGSKDAGAQVAEMLGLADILKKKPKELSGGFKSRVSLARALASEPKVILLDEPLSDIDAATKENLLPQFRDVFKSHEIPVLYVTHDVREAEIVGDSFAVMIGGKVMEISSARMAFDMIRDNYLNSFMPAGTAVS
ncbi:ATP-binding cassette domain-containing protein [Desulfoscipio gibsoniae]|uniref:ATPase component of ABC-type sugar transporter n=1 Tax=Desulfoscipio gibsoniae DSM 7213 TaxID=767817 RepID=R4KHG7_9FIRM|nr:ABC transporter ATP-binding protein [Desulfoscipio gibsoniae]AGL01092.1 ATPase component of ABC-type sugar transporter [Desulfoscipio gibsoniae DSM 7213]